jgi:ATP/maltotriose-dependent transcriptional regulator MalT/DNA-binding SARP family transcriptional activator
MHLLTLPSKFSPPLPGPFILKRKRLLSSIQKNISKKVITIVAGAGYGKTTLSSQIFQNISLQKLFFTLEEDDRNPTFFLLSLIQGMVKLFPSFHRYADMISSHTEDSIPFLKKVVKSICNDILYNLKGKIYLFFDAEKDLPDGCETFTTIDSLMHYSSKNIRFIFSSRHPFALESICKLRLENKVYEITQKDMAFTKDELQLLLKRIYKQPTNEKEVDLLLKHTGGWAAGIQMIAQRTEKSKSISKSLNNFVQTEKDLSEYFLHRVFKREPKKMQKFLRRSSIFKELNAEVCNAIYRKNNTKEILRYLERNQMFTFCIDAKREIYRYHPLFRKFLLDLLTTDEEKKLHNSAGNYFFTQKKYAQAIQHFIKAQSHSQIVSVLKEYAPQLWKKGKHIILKKYLKSIPEETIRESPYILLCQAKLKRMERKYAEIEDELSLCDKKFTKAKQWTKVFETKIYLMTTKQRNGHTEKALSIARKLQKKLLKKKNNIPETLKILFFTELAGIYFEIQDYEQMEESLKKALTYLDRVNNPKWECTVKGNLAIIEAQKGNFQEVYDTLSALWERYRFQYPFYVGYICANLISCEIIMKHYHDAQFYSEWLLEYSKRFHQDFLSVLAYNFLAKTATLLGKPKRAEILLNKSLNVSNNINSKEALCSVYETFIEYYLHSKKYKISKKYLRILKGERCHVTQESKFYFYEGKILWGMDKPEKAMESLKNSLKMAKKSGDKYSTAKTLWYLTLLSYNVSRKEECLQYAQKVLKLIRRKNYHFLFSFDKKELALFQFLQSSSGIVNGLLQDILEKTTKGKEMIGKKEYKKERIGVISKPNSSISIHFLGEFQISKEQKKLAIKWHSSKIFSLFAYLAARPGFHSVDLLIENFWGESPLSKSYSSLYTAVSYIRSHLSPFIENIIENEKKSYRLNPNIIIKRDVEEFENFYRAGRKFENKKNFSLAIENYERAREIYCGDFLENFYDPWMEEERVYYQGEYLRMLKTLGNLYKQKGDYLIAKNLYLAYVTREPYEEDAYCELFKIFAHLKDKRNLIDTHNRLIVHLSELSSAPSLTTKKVYSRAFSSL